MREFCAAVPPLLVAVSGGCRAGWLNVVLLSWAYADRFGWVAAGVLVFVPGGDGGLASGVGSEGIQSFWGAWYQVGAVGLMAGSGRRDGSAGGEP